MVSSGSAVAMRVLPTDYRAGRTPFRTAARIRLTRAARRFAAVTGWTCFLSQRGSGSVYRRGQPGDVGPKAPRHRRARRAERPRTPGTRGATWRRASGPPSAQDCLVRAARVRSMPWPGERLRQEHAGQDPERGTRARSGGVEVAGAEVQLRQSQDAQEHGVVTVFQEVWSRGSLPSGQRLARPPMTPADQDPGREKRRQARAALEELSTGRSTVHVMEDLSLTPAGLLHRAGLLAGRAS